MEAVKRIPYGVSDFVAVVEQNQYYVDKTMYLPLLEQQPSNLFLIRPRRFGKSIFLNMLRAYYDSSQKAKFEKRFGNLWIGQNPTPLQGRYQVLFLDFSKAGVGIENLEANFNLYCRRQLDGISLTWCLMSRAMIYIMPLLMPVVFIGRYSRSSRACSSVFL